MKLKLPKPYISSSQITTWHYSKGQYVDRYIFGIPTVESPELLFGKRVSELLEKGKWGRESKIVKQVLDRLIRYSKPEHELKATLSTPKGDVDVLGYIDSYSPLGTNVRIKKPRIMEYKTGAKLWDKKRADEHFQTQLYAGIIYKQTGILPEVKIQWVQTHRVAGISVPTGVVRTFRVVVTVSSVLAALKEAQRVAMEISDWYAEYLDGAKTAPDPNGPDLPVPDWML